MNRSPSPTLAEGFVVVEPSRQHNLVIRSRSRRGDVDAGYAAVDSDDDLEPISRPGSVRSLSTSSTTSFEETDRHSADGVSHRPAEDVQAPATGSQPLAGVTQAVSSNASNRHIQPQPLTQSMASRNEPDRLTFWDPRHGQPVPAPKRCDHETLDQNILDQLIESGLKARIEQEYGKGEAHESQLRQQMLARLRRLPVDHRVVKEAMDQAQGAAFLFQDQPRSSEERCHIYSSIFTDVELTALYLILQSHKHHFGVACQFADLPYGPELPNSMGRSKLLKAASLSLEVSKTCIMFMDGDDVKLFLRQTQLKSTLWNTASWSTTDTQMRANEVGEKVAASKSMLFRAHAWCGEPTRVWAGRLAQVFNDTLLDLPELAGLKDELSGGCKTTAARQPSNKRRDAEETTFPLAKRRSVPGAFPNEATEQLNGAPFGHMLAPRTTNTRYTGMQHGECSLPCDDTPVLSESLVCHLCERNVGGKTQLTSHLMLTHLSNRQCPACNLISKSVPLQFMHVRDCNFVRPESELGRTIAQTTRAKHAGKSHIEPASSGRLANDASTNIAEYSQALRDHALRTGIRDEDAQLQPWRRDADRQVSLPTQPVEADTGFKQMQQTRTKFAFVDETPPAWRAQSNTNEHGSRNSFPALTTADSARQAQRMQTMLLEQQRGQQAISTEARLNSALVQHGRSEGPGNIRCHVKDGTECLELFKDFQYWRRHVAQCHKPWLQQVMVNVRVNEMQVSVPGKEMLTVNACDMLSENREDSTSSVPDYSTHIYHGASPSNGVFEDGSVLVASQHGPMRMLRKGTSRSCLTAPSTVLKDSSENGRISPQAESNESTYCPAAPYRAGAPGNNISGAMPMRPRRGLHELESRQNEGLDLDSGMQESRGPQPASMLTRPRPSPMAPPTLDTSKTLDDLALALQRIDNSNNCTLPSDRPSLSAARIAEERKYRDSVYRLQLNALRLALARQEQDERVSGRKQ